MTAHVIMTAAGHHNLALAIWGGVELVLIISWIAMFAFLFGLLAVLTTARGRRRRRQAAAAKSALSRPAPNGSGPERLARAAPPAGLESLRRVDPNFDEQLLLDAALTATMLMFVASSTGDIAPINRLATDSFWKTKYGELASIGARYQRRQARQRAEDLAADRKPTGNWNIPLDYQASVPEVVAVSVGAMHTVRVRVYFDQLAALVRPGAAGMAAAGSATNFGSAMLSLGVSMMQQQNNGQPSIGVSWIGADGRYDLEFVRPSSARTDPSTAFADRTCTKCGAAYRSEFATACAYCGTQRALPWGEWRLAEATPVV